MPLYSWSQDSFTAGEISPLLNARAEVDQRRKGLKTCTNMVIDPRGPLLKRGGFALAAEQYGATYIPVREIPFVFSETPTQSYILEFGYISSTFAGYIRVIYKDSTDTISTVLVSSVPYSGTGITGTDPATNIVLQLHNIWYAQLGDIMFLVDGVHVMYELKRTGTSQPGTWTIEASSMTLPPWNELRNSMTYTYYTLNGNFSWGSSGGFPANKDELTTLFSRGIQVNTGNHVDYIVGDNGIYFGADLATHTALPTYMTQSTRFGWKLEGKLFIPETGIYVFALNSHQNADLYINGDLIAYRWGYLSVGVYDGTYGDTGQFQESISFRMSDTLVANSHAEILCRLVYAIQGGGAGIQVGWRKESGDTSNGVSFVPSGSKTDDLTIFRGASNSDVMGDVTGQTGWDGDAVYEIKLIKSSATEFKYIVRAVSDGVTATQSWADAETALQYYSHVWAGYASTQGYLWIRGFAPMPSPFTGVNFCTIKIDSFSSHDVNDYWIFRVGCVSIPTTFFQRTEPTGISTTLYPRIVGFHEDRLLLANSPAHPDSVWLSKSGNYRSFKTGADDDDSIQFTLSSGQPDPIQWAESTRFLMLGTASNIYVVKSNGAYLSPSDLDIKPYSAIGSAMIKPCKIGSTIFFVERSERIIRELSYDAISESFGGRDLTALSPHLFASDIKEIVYLQSAILTKKPYPRNILAAVFDDGTLLVMTHEKDHEVAGWSRFTTEGTVESASAIPASSGDAMWILEKHTVASNITINSTAIKTASYYGIKYLDPDKYEDDVLIILDGAYGTGLTLTVPHMASKYGRIYSRPNSGGAWSDLGLGDSLFVFSAAGVRTLSIEYWSVAHEKDMKVCYVFPITVTPMPLEIPVSGGTAKNAKKRIAECFVEMMDSHSIMVNGVTISDVDSATVPASQRITLAGWNETPTLSLTQNYPDNFELLSISAKVAVNAY